MNNLTAYERETIINFNEEDSTASVYTFNKRLLNRLENVSKVNHECSLVRSTENHAEYIVPKRWIKVNPPKQMSEKQKERLRELCKNRISNEDLTLDSTSEN